MKVFPRSIKAALLLGLGLLPLNACTAKYQDMLRDRDETIRDLEGKLSTARGENGQLRRDLDKAKNDLSAAKARPAPVTTAKKDPAAALNAALRAGGVASHQASARYVRNRLSIGIANKVTFASGSTKISKEGQNVLRRIARVIQSRFPGKRIYIEGHTDSDPLRRTKGKYRSNRHLSAERADVVASFLTTKAGLPESRVVIMGFGPFDPVASGKKAANRRVEIVVADSE